MLSARARVCVCGAEWGAGGGGGCYCEWGKPWRHRTDVNKAAPESQNAVHVHTQTRVRIHADPQRSVTVHTQTPVRHHADPLWSVTGPWTRRRSRWVSRSGRCGCMRPSEGVSSAVRSRWVSPVGTCDPTVRGCEQAWHEAVHARPATVHGSCGSLCWRVHTVVLLRGEQDKGSGRRSALSRGNKALRAGAAAAASRWNQNQQLQLSEPHRLSAWQRACVAHTPGCAGWALCFPASPRRCGWFCWSWTQPGWIQISVQVLVQFRKGWFWIPAARVAKFGPVRAVKR